MQLSLLSITLLLVVGSYAAEELYSNKYDNVDFIAILRDEEKLRGYIKCLLDEGPCTPDGNFLKEVLPDAITTRCRKCSAFHRKFAKISAHFLIHNFPEHWERLMQRFDPESKHRASLMEFLNEKEI